jgi:sec-independent protein translocase protein TatA
VLYLKDAKEVENGVVMFALIFGLGPLEIIIIVVVIVLLFLPALLPKMAKRMGETFRMVKDMAESKLDDDDKSEKSEKEDTADKE